VLLEQGLRRGLGAVGDFLEEVRRIFRFFCTTLRRQICARFGVVV
jgi:hypothetical protein